MKHHNHPICKICNIEIQNGDSVYECKNDDCGTIVHQKCYKMKNDGN